VRQVELLGEPKRVSVTTSRGESSCTSGVNTAPRRGSADRPGLRGSAHAADFDLGLRFKKSAPDLAVYDLLLEPSEDSGQGHTYGGGCPQSDAARALTRWAEVPEQIRQVAGHPGEGNPALVAADPPPEGVQNEQGPWGACCSPRLQTARRSNRSRAASLSIVLAPSMGNLSRSMRRAARLAAAGSRIAVAACPPPSTGRTPPRATEPARSCSGPTPTRPARCVRGQRGRAAGTGHDPPAADSTPGGRWPREVQALNSYQFSGIFPDASG
jgi:hypothetical protein